MPYPLPVALAQSLRALIEDCEGDSNALFDAFADLLVRQNRLTRRLMLRMAKSFGDAAELEEDPTRRAMGCLGEDLLKDVARSIKESTYFDSERAARAAKAVEDIISAFYEEDDAPNS